MHRPTFAALLALSACACAGGDPGAPNPAGSRDETGSKPATSRASATYEVPVEPALAAAATFLIEEIEWSADAGSASLSYKLPFDLVGRAIHVDFSGPVSGGASAALVGEAGTADCTIAMTEVACKENLEPLMPINPDLSAVAARAPETYTGPATDRVQVAEIFAADPIGIVRFRLDPTGD